MIRPALLAVVLVASAFLTSGVQAQSPAPAPAPQTFWNWMGIPSQPFAGIRNRGGNFPEAERKPALKPIADPANLASADPAIKKAAEIKAQEDLAAQKIKAIKYLAEIGCGGCYKGVDKALADALDDCTEAVRYEAVQAVLAASACGQNECVKKCVRKTKTCKESMCDCWVGCMKRTCATMHLLCGKAGPDGVTLKSKLPGYGCGAGGNCPGRRCACGDGNCCTSEILNKLSTMAFEKDDRGCWKEPSPRVRAMARQALRACGPNIRPMTTIDIPVPEEVPLNIEAVPPAPVPEKREEFKPEKREEFKPDPRAEDKSAAKEPAAEFNPATAGARTDETLAPPMQPGPEDARAPVAIPTSLEVAPMPSHPMDLTVTQQFAPETQPRNAMRQTPSGQKPKQAAQSRKQVSHPNKMQVTSSKTQVTSGKTQVTRAKTQAAPAKTPAAQSGNRVASTNGWRWPWEDLGVR